MDDNMQRKWNADYIRAAAKLMERWDSDEDDAVTPRPQQKKFKKRMCAKERMHFNKTKDDSNDSDITPVPSDAESEEENKKDGIVVKKGIDGEMWKNRNETKQLKSEKVTDTRFKPSSIRRINTDESDITDSDDDAEDNARALPKSFQSNADKSEKDNRHQSIRSEKQKAMHYIKDKVKVKQDDVTSDDTDTDTDTGSDSDSDTEQRREPLFLSSITKSVVYGKNLSKMVCLTPLSSEEEEHTARCSFKSIDTSSYTGSSISGSSSSSDSGNWSSSKDSYKTPCGSSGEERYYAKSEMRSLTNNMTQTDYYNNMRDENAKTHISGIQGAGNDMHEQKMGDQLYDSTLHPTALQKALHYIYDTNNAEDLTLDVISSERQNPNSRMDPNMDSKKRVVNLKKGSKIKKYKKINHHKDYLSSNDDADESDVSDCGHNRKKKPCATFASPMDINLPRNTDIRQVLRSDKAYLSFVESSFMSFNEGLCSDSEATYTAFTLPPGIARLYKQAEREEEEEEGDGEIRVSISAEVCLTESGYILKEHLEVIGELNDVSIEQLSPDMHIMINRNRFSCSQLLLSSYCGYFRNLPTLNATEMSLPEDEVSANAFYMLYQWIIWDSVTINYKYLLKLFKAATFLDVKTLVEQIWYTLSNDKLIREEHAFVCYLEAQKLLMPAVQSIMLPRISKYFLIVVSYPQFVDMPIFDLCTLLNMNRLAVCNELEIFYSAVRWLVADWKEREQYVIDVMKCVRFGLMSGEILTRLNTNPEKVYKKIITMPAVQDMIIAGITLNSLRYDRRSEPLHMTHFMENLQIIMPKPRIWVYDPYALHQHNINCSGWRKSTYKLFALYLIKLQDDPNVWEDLEYIKDTRMIKCCSKLYQLDMISSVGSGQNYEMAAAPSARSSSALP